MARFHYRAVTPAGAVEDGQMDAVDEAAVVRSLQAAGYLPIRAGSRARTRRLLPTLRGRNARLTPQVLLAFTHDLALLLRAGLPLDHALRLIGELTDDATARTLIGNLQDALRSGSPLSSALAEQSGAALPSFYIALVRAGEAGGTLEPTLTRLHDYLERSQALRSSVRAALIYPALLFAVSLLSVTILLVFVVPQFGQLLADSGHPVPQSTAIVLAASDFLRAYGWLCLPIALAAAALLRRRLAREDGRTRADAWLLRLPVCGDLVARLETARFSRALGTLLQNGVPLLAAVDIAGGVFGNRVLSAALPALIESLKHGRGMAAPLLAAGHFPVLAVQLIRIGEESGQLDAMLLRAADMLDADVKQRIQNLLTILEPALIVVLGLVIAAVLVAMLSAILSMNDIPL